AKNKTLSTVLITRKVFFIWSEIMVEIRGIDQLIGKLKRSADLGLVKKTVQLNGAELDKRMKRNATFVKGYQTGETKRSITTSLSDSGLSSTTKPTTHYSFYLEKRSEERRVGKECGYRRWRN